MGQATKEQIDVWFKIVISILSGVLVPWSVWVTNAVYMAEQDRRVFDIRMQYLVASIAQIQADQKDLRDAVRTIEKK